MTDQQRRAMFAKRGARRQRLGLAARHASEKTNPAILGTAAGVGMVGAVHPRVTHVPYAGVRETAKGILKGYPQLRYYPAVPAVAAYAASRTGPGKQTQKESLQRAAGAGAVGLGAFLGERAMFHSIPAFAPPNRMMPKALRRLGIPLISNKLRAELLLGHGLPLGAAALALGGLAHHMAKKGGYAKEQDAFKQLRTGALIGLGTVGAHFGGVQLIPRLMLKPGVAKAAQKAVDMGVVPPYLAYQALKARREKARRKGIS